MTGPSTRWRIVAAGISLPKLNVVLSVDTTAPLVVAAIEYAAAKNGIELERIEEDE